MDRSELYGRNPVDSESGIDGGVELVFDAHQRISGGITGPAIATEAEGLPQLSGRSRELLKRYFEETDAFVLPVGHPTLAFTESQVYNLLRVLTDEIIRMSYFTIERMVNDAVKETPTTAPSRTSHFRSEDRDHS